VHTEQAAVHPAEAPAPVCPQKGRQPREQQSLEVTLIYYLLTISKEIEGQVYRAVHVRVQEMINKYKSALQGSFA
jgi:hypothetical protein